MLDTLHVAIEVGMVESRRSVVREMSYDERLEWVTRCLTSPVDSCEAEFGSHWKELAAAGLKSVNEKAP